MNPVSISLDDVSVIKSKRSSKEEALQEQYIQVTPKLVGDANIWL
jgi:hypothetical protein